MFNRIAKLVKIINEVIIEEDLQIPVKYSRIIEAVYSDIPVEYNCIKQALYHKNKSGKIKRIKRGYYIPGDKHA